MILNAPLIGFIDLFCGMGGTSWGVEMTELRKRKLAEVIACVNHDPNAINSHYLNLPHVKHFTEDIRTLDLRQLVAAVKVFRMKYPFAKIAIWASLECTNFSKAKGGLSRKADSRTLAEHLFRYIDAINPDYIFIENVVEFLDWGPLRVKCTSTNNRFSKLAVDKKGELVYIPVKEKKGTYYTPWKDKMCSYGYQYSKRVLMAADYGIRQTRKRLFLQFSRNGLPYGWPEPTHDKKGKNGLPFWLPVRPLLDLHDKGGSLFERLPGKKQFRFESEKSRERILAGCIKFIAKGDKSFLTKHFTAKQVNSSVDEPAGTIKCRDNHSVAQMEFMTAFYSSGGEIADPNKPSPTVPTKDRLALVQPEPFLMDMQFKNSAYSPNKPSPTIIAHQDKKPMYLVVCEFAEGDFGIEVYDNDSPATVSLKKLMAAYRITDIKIRMLNEKELLRIQDFPDTYKMVGTSAERKKYIGNAVPPGLATKVIGATANELLNETIEQQSLLKIA